MGAITDMRAEGAIGKSGEGTPLFMSRGSTQTGMRIYNERLVLSLIRSKESVSKAETARLTGLSAQTVSVIVRQLEAEGLVMKGLSVKGKVGQPSQPFSLNPEGAFSIGLKVGRHSGDLLLLDLTGKIRRKVHKPYRFPTAQEYLQFVKSGMTELLADLSPAQIARISGLGIASPLELWNWEEEIGASRDVLGSWRDFDLVGEIAKLGTWPVYFSNDGTAACAAERLFGIGDRYHSYAYFFVGYFVGGGIFVNDHVLPGRTGYAAAVGSLPVSIGDGKQQQLIHSASLFVLEKQLLAAGLNPAVVTPSPERWLDLGPVLDRWIDTAAKSLAFACAASMSIIDFEAIIIDGAMPPDVRTRLVAKTRDALLQHDLRGLPAFTIEPGSLGSDARAMGGASLSLFANFMVDRDILFKD